MNNIDGNVGLICCSVVLSSIKDIAQSALVKRVYRVPIHTAVSPVKYCLPKGEFYIRRDVLR